MGIGPANELINGALRDRKSLAAGITKISGVIFGLKSSVDDLRLGSSIDSGCESFSGLGGNAPNKSRSSSTGNAIVSGSD